VLLELGRAEMHVGLCWGKTEGGKPSRRHRYRWQYNVKVELKEIVWEGVDWIHLTQDRDTRWAVVDMNLCIP
jgi:hypothetical protein